MSDKNGALRHLEQSYKMVQSRINLLNNDRRQLEYQLSQQRKKTKNLEEALYFETLAKMSDRKKADVSMLSMYYCYVILFVFIVAITLSGVPSC